MKNHCDYKSAKTSAAKKDWPLRPLFMLVILAFLMIPLPVDGGLGTQGGPLSAEWQQRNWGNTFGGEGTDEAFAMDLTADGGYILAGGTYSFDQGAGYGDAWILKLGPGGEVEWEKSYGDSFWDSIHAIQQTSTGGYIAAGTRYPPGGSQEAWVLKLKPDGEVDWQNTYGRADYYDGGWSIQQTAGGGFILLGWTQSYAIGGEQGAWVLKLTGSGEIEWQKFLGGNRYDFLFSLEQTADGGYVLAGGTFSYSDVPWFSEVWMVKLFSNGDVDWEKTYGGIYNDVAYSVKQSQDGGYVLGCWTSFSYGDVLVLKTDANGNLEWQKRYGGSYEDVPFSLKLTSDGGFIIGGYTSSFGSGYYDGWVIKIAGGGRLEWQKTFGGTGDDAFTDIEETATGYAATGYTASFGAGEADVWCIHFTPSGPGTVLLKSIAGSSHAVSPSMEVAEAFITGFISTTQVSPVASVTAVSATSSSVSVLSEFPGHGEVFLSQGRGHSSGIGPWPIFMN